MEKIYFNVYTESYNSHWVCICCKDDNGKFISCEEINVLDVDLFSRIRSILNDIGFVYGGFVFEKFHELSYKEARTELRSICKSLVSSGFIFDDEVFEYMVEDFADEGGSYPNPIFLSEDFE